MIVRAQLTVALVLAAGACRGSEAEAPSEPVVEPEQHDPEPPPTESPPPKLRWHAAVPLPSTDPPPPAELAPEREAFWRRFLGDAPGEAGPEMLAWCGKPNKAGDRSIGPGVTLTSDCVLLAGRGDAPGTAEYVAELIAFVARWEAPIEQSLNAGSVKSRGIDQVNRLTVSMYYDAAGWLNLHWTPFLELEKLFGEPGQLLRGIDVEALVGAPPTKLRRVTRPPFELETCNVRLCSARAPGPPGGSPTTITITRTAGGRVSIDVAPLARDLLRVLDLVEQSLGPADQAATDALGDALSIVYRRGPIRYTVTRLRTTLVAISVDREAP